MSSKCDKRKILPFNSTQLIVLTIGKYYLFNNAFIILCYHTNLVIWCGYRARNEMIYPRCFSQTNHIDEMSKHIDKNNDMRKNVVFFKIIWFDFVCVACLIRRIIVEYDMSIIQPVPILPTQFIENSTRAAFFQDDIRTSTAYTVKPVYNDHLMGYFSAFWSSSRWPRAT